jgi:hypothetical protein
VSGEAAVCQGRRRRPPGRGVPSPAGAPCCRQRRCGGASAPPSWRCSSGSAAGSPRAAYLSQGTAGSFSVVFLVFRTPQAKHEVAVYLLTQMTYLLRTWECPGSICRASIRQCHEAHLEMQFCYFDCQDDSRSHEPSCSRLSHQEKKFDL